MTTITDDQIRELLASTREGRQNAHTRALRNDCMGALEGSVVCRERCAEVLSNRQKFAPKKRSKS